VALASQKKVFNLTTMNCTFQESIELIGPHEVGTKPADCYGCTTYLNTARLIHKVRRNGDNSIDREAHEKWVGDQAPKFVHEMPLDELFVYLKGFEAFTSYVSFLYSQRLIKERVADPSKLKDKTGKEFAKAVAEMKHAARPKKELKHLSDFDKTIQVLVSAGIPEAIAKSEVEKQFKAQGKVTS
jgi:hypothetical protein